MKEFTVKFCVVEHHPLELFEGRNTLDIVENMTREVVIDYLKTKNLDCFLVHIGLNGRPDLRIPYNQDGMIDVWARAYAELCFPDNIVHNKIKLMYPELIPILNGETIIYIGNNFEKELWIGSHV